jgi:hypothetical protein
MCEIVTFELSKKLKENGFPQRPDYFHHSSYYEWDGLRKIHPLYNVNVWFDPCTNRDNLYFAPTISQVLKWLRDEKKIHVEIDIMKAYPEAKLIYWGYNIVLIDKYEVYHFEWNSNSYEEAALAGIEYVLDNLKKIKNYE